MEDLFNLRGKVAVVTGAASGIGLASSEWLARMGARVVLTDIRELPENALAGSEPESHRWVWCDVSDPASCQRLAADIREREGRVHILVNSAGIIVRKSVTDLEESEWDLVVDVGLKGVYLTSKFLIPLMTEGGSIVNIASGWGLKAGPEAAAYCAAKAGVVNLTRSMAIDYGPRGVRVNSVAPGDTMTPLLLGEARQLGLDADRFLAESAAERPLGRLGTPDDIAKAVLFLAGDLSSWVTGSTLVVDGGGLA